MDKKAIYYVALLLTLINLGVLGTVVYYRIAGNNASPSNKTRNQMFEEVKRKLVLTPAQISKFQASRFVFYARIDSLSRILTNERTDLANELWVTPIDRARINSLIDSVGMVQSAAQRAIIAHLLDVRKVLTPEQQEKLHAIVLRRFASRQPIPGRY